jgi:hypothetical protein
VPRLKDIIVKEDNGVKKRVGRLNESDNIFITKRDSTKHLLRKYNAWAIDKKLVEEILVPKNTLIRIESLNERKIYELHAQEFVALAKETDYYQHRPQLYVNKEKFRVRKA